MATIQTTLKKLKEGVQLTTTKPTTVQLRSSLIQILIGGPYKTKTGIAHPYGHAALRVITKDIERIYDFGRYRKTSGVFGSEGEGIMRVWSNFGSYIDGENETGRVTTGYLYEVSDDRAKFVIDHFTQITTAPPY